MSEALDFRTVSVLSSSLVDQVTLVLASLLSGLCSRMHRAAFGFSAAVCAGAEALQPVVVGMGLSIPGGLRAFALGDTVVRGGCPQCVLRI